MTLAELERRARTGLTDTVEEYRWSPSVVLTALCEGVRHLQSVRPETRYVGGKLKEISFPVTDAGAAGYSLTAARAWNVPVDERWAQGLVYYAMARCFEIDSSDTSNQLLAADFFNKAETRFQQ